MGLADKLLKTGSIKESNVISKSRYFKDKDIIQTDIPILNLAMSGRLDGGFSAGLTVLGGPSKHYKSNLGLKLVASFLEKYANEDAICLFYDSEFGATETYFKNANVDPERVIHVPMMNIEELKFDIAQKLESIDKDDKVIIFVDSVGNLASKKEVQDAMDEKAVADMTRAKQLKSVFRIATPYLTSKNIPMIVINHTYSEIGMHPKQVLSGGTGLQYAADTAFIIGRRQQKEGNDVTGWDFILNAEKSRYIKEKSALPYSVTYNGGVDKYSGLLDIALLTGDVTKPKQGWYTRPGIEGDKNWRRKESSCAEFWDPLLKDKEFCARVEDLYSLGSPEQSVEMDVFLEEVDEEG